MNFNHTFYPTLSNDLARVKLCLMLDQEMQEVGEGFNISKVGTSGAHRAVL